MNELFVGCGVVVGEYPYDSSGGGESGGGVWRRRISRPHSRDERVWASSSSVRKKKGKEECTWQCTEELILSSHEATSPQLFFFYFWMIRQCCKLYLFTQKATSSTLIIYNLDRGTIYKNHMKENCIVSNKVKFTTHM